MDRPAIAEIFECHEQTVRATLQRWKENGLRGLWEAPRRGAKRRRQKADLAAVEQWLEQDSRTNNSGYLAEMSGLIGHEPLLALVKPQRLQVADLPNVWFRGIAETVMS